LLFAVNENKFEILFCGGKETRSAELIDLPIDLRHNFSDDPLITRGTAVSFSGTTTKEQVCNARSPLLLLPVIGSPIVEPVAGAEPLGTLVGVEVME
jgi:hypothetical protein